MVEGTREIDSKACDEVEFGDAKQTLRKRRRRPLVGDMLSQSTDISRSKIHVGEPSMDNEIASMCSCASTIARPCTGRLEHQKYMP